MDEPVIRQYLKGDEVGIIKLLTRVFNGWPHYDLECSSLDHWKWKYEDNPVKLKAVSVAEYQNEIVGCSHGFYYKLKMGEKTLLAQQGSDLAVHEDYRGQGIYQKMVKLKDISHMQNKANLTCSTSNNPIVIKNDLKKNRPQFPHPIRQLIKIHDVSFHFKTKKIENPWFKKFGYITISTLYRVKNKIFSSNDYKIKSSCNISEISSFDKSFDTFWNENKKYYNFITEKTSNYLNWRYCDPRAGIFIIKQACDENELLGYIVLRINKYNQSYHEGYIADLLTLPGRLDIANALLHDAERVFNENKVNVIYLFTVKGHPYKRLFERNGFLDSQLKYILFLTPLDVGEEYNDFMNSPQVNCIFLMEIWIGYKRYSTLCAYSKKIFQYK